MSTLQDMLDELDYAVSRLSITQLDDLQCEAASHESDATTDAESDAWLEIHDMLTHVIDAANELQYRVDEATESMAYYQREGMDR